MLIPLSKEEIDLIEKETNDCLLGLDSNIKNNLKEIFESFSKQINCFHDFQVNDKLKLCVCTHCNLKKPHDYLEYLMWLKEVVNNYNLGIHALKFSFIDRKITRQHLINLFWKPEMLYILFQNKISYIAVGRFCIYAHCQYYSIDIVKDYCTNFTPEIKKKIEEILKPKYQYITWLESQNGTISSE